MGYDAGGTIMADLMIPLLILVIMYVLIDALDAGIVLMSIALIWLPISFMMYSTITTNAYDALFGATIANTPMALTIVGLMAFTVPLFALAKIFYIRKLLIGEKENNNESV